MSAPEEEPTLSPPSSLVNGKSPHVNGIAPVRHETNGSNKNLTIEIDIPPGMWLTLTDLVTHYNTLIRVYFKFSNFILVNAIINTHIAK